MEDCRFTANKWRIDLLQRQVEELNSRTMALSKSQMWSSIALAVVFIALFVHILLFH